MENVYGSWGQLRLPLTPSSFVGDSSTLGVFGVELGLEVTRSVPPPCIPLILPVMVKISSKSDEKSIFGEFFKIFEKFLTSRGRDGRRRTLPLTGTAFPENLVAIRSTIDFWQKFQKVVHLASHRGRHCRRRPLASHGGTRHIHLNNHRKFHQIISNRSRLIETDVLLQLQSFSGFELKTSFTAFL